ncbi:type II toxin-antitoxin system Phd/YefM family antitoxin [Aeromicrobium sp. YIM 150415]|uniref:type II toxin-antitoxin system Phd/YefM family antitoxin n=1 Tax=Aeromicrobium sp. YIM 150415 TaxID=2803912 RepID=UPI0019653592|nr:type II toxin-antitoxin system Phd/YefM family antitoxin [Aeromicrobium sp. YIM 150415]MBM9465451.1 type II toxin-antitoxin system Phd/YefM family antitoxin [Aeromicrobium sp. YIM 150415]
MKTVSVSELRQGPTRTLAAVEAGDTYAITRHHRVIGYIVPPDTQPGIPPPKKAGPARTARLLRHDPRTAATVDELIDDMKDA